MTLLAHMGPAYPALRELRSVCLPRPALGFFIPVGHHQAMVTDRQAERSAYERGHSVTPRSISINSRANSAATLR